MKKLVVYSNNVDTYLETDIFNVIVIFCDKCSLFTLKTYQLPEIYLLGS